MSEEARKEELEATLTEISEMAKTNIARAEEVAAAQAEMPKIAEMISAKNKRRKP